MKLWVQTGLLLLSCLLVLSSCGAASGANDVRESTFFALDTYCTLRAYGLDREHAAALEEARARVSWYEENWSVTSSEGEVAALNRGESVKLSDETRAVLKAARETSELTGGAFDVTVAPVVEAYGFYSDHYRVPSEEELADLLSRVGSPLPEIQGEWYQLPGAMIDLGAIAKGFIADALADDLMQAGACGALISLGGNVCARGTKEDGSLFTVAVTDPADPSAYLGTLEMTDASLVTAGGYQRGFTENGVYYHHILDPKTGRPAESGLLSASVLCADGARADALSTACFVLGEEASLSLWRTCGDFELILVREDGGIVCTEGLSSRFVAEGKDAEFVKKNA